MVVAIEGFKRTVVWVHRLGTVVAPGSRQSELDITKVPRNSKYITNVYLHGAVQ